MEFEEALDRFGFRLREERSFAGKDAQLYVSQPNRFMTYTLHVYADGTAIFTWEFALADFLATHGIQVGSDEALNQFLYPREDFRGQQDGTWLMSAIERTEAMLADLRFDRPEG